MSRFSMMFSFVASIPKPLRLRGHDATGNAGTIRPSREDVNGLSPACLKTSPSASKLLKDLGVMRQSQALGLGLTNLSAQQKVSLPNRRPRTPSPVRARPRSTAQMREGVLRDAVPFHIRGVVGRLTCAPSDFALDAERSGVGVGDFSCRRIRRCGGAGGSGFAAGGWGMGVAVLFAALAFFGAEVAAYGDGEDEGDGAEEGDEDDGDDVHECVAPLRGVESSCAAVASRETAVPESFGETASCGESERLRRPRSAACARRGQPVALRSWRPSLR